MLDPIIEIASNHIPSFNSPRQTNDPYDTWRTMNFSVNSQRTPINYENCRNWNGGGVQFKDEAMEDETGVFSPPLWKTSPPKSPVHSRYAQNNFRYLSPNSRAQAIARGQRELMEMVQNMPESCYELSFKDLVEHPWKLEAQEERLVGEIFFGRQGVNPRVKEIKGQESQRNDNRTKVMRSRSMDNGGLFLKMVFPISFGSKKKKNSATNTHSRVLPKLEVMDKSSKTADLDRWKKRLSVSSESECGISSSSSNGSSGSRGSTSSSCSNSGRQRSGCSPCCWSFSVSRENKKCAQPE